MYFAYRGLVPLHNACSYGHYEVTELLVKHGASVNIADLWKFTPLHEAAAKGKYEIVKLLLKVVDFVPQRLLKTYRFLIPAWCWSKQKESWWGHSVRFSSRWWSRCCRSFAGQCCAFRCCKERQSCSCAEIGHIW